MNEFRIQILEMASKKVNYCGIELQIPGCIIEINYVTTDKNGHVRGWHCPPYPEKNNWTTQSPSDMPIEFGKAKFKGDWKESMRKVKDIIIK